MNGRSPHPWPENIERIIELGEGNGYAQPWESVRKGPSLLAELAEKTGKDIDALTPEERIAFRIGWVRGRIRKYEEAGTVDPAEIAHAKENEEFYRKKLQQVLEKPPAAPEAKPAPRHSPQPTPEATAEAPSFSRYLKNILADPAAPEAVNLLIKFRSPNGRLWIDKKKSDGSVVRIWLSLNLTSEEKSKPDAEFIEIIKSKLTPDGLRFRVDDLSTGNSWKEKWATKKTEVSSLITAITAAPDAERPLAILALGRALFGPDEASHEQNIKVFIALLQQYLTRPDGKTDIWTHVRNAYWHADGWQDEGAAQAALTGHGITAPFTRPTYESARMRVWEKIEGNHRTFLESKIGTETPLHYRGTPLTRGPIAQKSIADGPAKGMWYSVGTHWIHAEHLRISHKYNSDGTMVEPPVFELMAWKVQTNPPTPPPLASPPPAGKQGPEPKGPPVPASGAKKEPSKPTAAPAAPPPAPLPKKGPDSKESSESAEVRREHDVIAIPDIHGQADALFASLKDAGYAETSDSSGDWRKGWQLTEAGEKARIVFTGDFFDRGKQNKDVATLVGELRKRKEGNVLTLFGNHDLMLLRAAKEGSGGAIEHMWQNDGDTTLEEILGQEEWDKLFAAYQICAHIDAFIKKVKTAVGKNAAQALEPKLQSAPRWVLSSLSTLYRWWKDEGRAHIQHVCEARRDVCGEHLIALQSDPQLQPSEATQNILDRTLSTLNQRVTQAGAFAEMTQNMQAMAQLDDVLYLHAGLSEEWIRLLCEKGSVGANAHFHTLLQDPVRLANMAGGGDKESSAILWARDLYTFLRKRPDLVQKLKNKGINMIVCGHTEQRDAQEHFELPSGFHIVYGDTGMGRGGGSFVRTHGRTSPKNGHVEGHIGARRDVRGNDHPSRDIPLTKLPPSK